MERFLKEIARNALMVLIILAFCTGCGARTGQKINQELPSEGLSVEAPGFFKGMMMVANSFSDNYKEQKEDVEKKLTKVSGKILDGKVRGFNKPNKELSAKVHNDLKKLVAGDSDTMREYARLEGYAKHQLGIKAEGGVLGSRIASFMNSRIKEVPETFRQLTYLQLLDLASFMISIYDLGQMISMQDSPSTVRKKVEYITKRLEAMESQYESSAASVKNKPAQV